MADTAAHLVDRVLPQTPVRQWVLSLPFSLRYRLAYDARLTRDVLRLFVRRVFASMRRRARDRPAARTPWSRPGRRPRRDRSGLSQRASACRDLLRFRPRTHRHRTSRRPSRVALRRQSRHRAPSGIPRRTLCEHGWCQRPRQRCRTAARSSTPRATVPDGTTHVGFEPLELLEKLAALVPPPRVNVVRYHGVLAPAARHRARVVPSESAPTSENGSTHADCETKPSLGRHSEPEDSLAAPRTRNYSWAELMRRVFEVDVLECPACRGPMRVPAAIHPPEATRAILDCLSLPSRSPPVSPPARDTPTVLDQGF